MRQAIAMSIMGIGFHFIKERKFFRYLTIVILATHFHETAILMLLLYFIYRFKFNFKNGFLAVIFILLYIFLVIYC